VEGDEVPSEDGRAVKLKSVWIRADLGQKGLAVECQCGSFSRYRTSCGQCGKKYPADLMRKRNFVNRMIEGRPDKFFEDKDGYA
jgi:hypothetical protein